MTSNKQVSFLSYDSINLKKLKDFDDPSKSVSASLKSEDDEQAWLKNLSNINLFVGPNNSGKSRLLRSLFISKDLCGNIRGYSLTEIINHLTNLKENLKNAIRGTNYASSPVHEFIRVIDDFVANSEEGLIQNGSILNLITKGIHLEALNDDTTRRIFGSSYQYQILSALKQGLAPLQTSLDFFQCISDAEPKNTSVYIPTLRSLRIFDAADIFSNKTKSEYFQQHNISYDLNNKSDKILFDGTNIYQDLTKRLLTSSIDRKKVIEYEGFLSNQFFNDREVQISPNMDDKAVHIKIGSDKDIPIYKLGDGMQAIITLTYPAFFLDKSARIHIEEPELFLHPGMQRRLLEVIMENQYLNRHQWFMTTHSNHFLDLTLELTKISVYRFQRKDNFFEIQNLSSPSFLLLNDLGINASSVFRTNSIIWVEGITDRLFLKQFLQIYCSKNKIQLPREDIDYSIVEYGGNNVTHFNFTHSENLENINVKYISERSFVVFDGDNKTKETRKRLIDSIAKNSRHVFDSKEIENILPVELIIETAKTLLKRSRVNAKKEKIALLSDSTLITTLSKNIRKRPLGKTLDEILNLNHFSDQSGTIKNKVNFCNTAIQIMQEQDDYELTEEARLLCEKVYSFIMPPN